MPQAIIKKKALLRFGVEIAERESCFVILMGALWTLNHLIYLSEFNCEN